MRSCEVEFGMWPFDVRADGGGELSMIRKIAGLANRRS